MICPVPIPRCTTALPQLSVLYPRRARGSIVRRTALPATAPRLAWRRNGEPSSGTSPSGPASPTSGMRSGRRRNRTLHLPPTRQTAPCPTNPPNPSGARGSSATSDASSRARFWPDLARGSLHRKCRELAEAVPGLIRDSWRAFRAWRGARPKRSSRRPAMTCRSSRRPAILRRGRASVPATMRAPDIGSQRRRGRETPG